MQRGIARVGTAINQAHAQDFERKRRPGLGDVGEDKDAEEEEGSSDDSGEETGTENAQDVMGAQDILRRHRSATID